MFWHTFKYRLKCLVRDRGTVFWTMIFPLVLATLFHFAFGHLTSDFEGFEPIPTAVIDDQAFRDDVRLQSVLQPLAEPGPNQFLEVTVLPAHEAVELLEKGEVYGIISVGNPMALTVKQRGLRQTILKAFLDEYTQTTKTISQIASEDPRALGPLLNALEDRERFTEQISFSQAQPDTNLGFFYALIAMTCLYSSFWGVRNTLHLQADQSPQAARRSVAPTHKASVVFSDTLAALVISCAEVLILLIYLKLALKISLGNEISLILLITLAGCVCGVALGNAIGTLVPGGEGLKIGILIGFNMLASFLAGLMWADMKDVIAQKAPILSYLNPAALIADSFYSLYIYDTHRRFFLNFSILVAISLLLSLISFYHLRRERFASL